MKDFSSDAVWCKLFSLISANCNDIQPKCVTRTTRGTKPRRSVSRWNKFDRMFSSSWGRGGATLSFDGQLSPVFHTPCFPPPSHHHTFQTSPLHPSHPFFFPELLRPSLAVGVTGDQEPVTPRFSLSSHPTITRPSFYVTLSSVPILLKSHYWAHFFLFPLLSLCPFQFFHSFTGSSCSWMAYWLGFLFTFTHIISPSLWMPLALSKSRSLDVFCSPVYCNTQASLISVFVCLSAAFLNVSIYWKLHQIAVLNFNLSPSSTHTNTHTHSWWRCWLK